MPELSKPVFALAPHNRTRVGGLEHYVEAGFPPPGALSQGASIPDFEIEPEDWTRWLHGWYAEAVEHGVTGLVIGLHGARYQDHQEMVRHILKIAAEYPFRRVVHRPHQEWRQGWSKHLGLTPAEWEDETKRVIDLSLDVGLRVDAMISHANRLEGVEETLPELSSIPVWPGISSYMPGEWPSGHKGIWHRESSAVAEMHRRTGRPVWIAECGVFADHRYDQDADWHACGLRCPDVIPLIFDPLEYLLDAGVLAGVTWWQKRIYFSGGWHDGRVDHQLAHPLVQRRFKELFGSGRWVLGEGRSTVTSGGGRK